MVQCIDLFAGAGGLSEGLSEAGFHCLFANEIMPVYAHTYMRNHVGTKVLMSDIRTVDAYAVLQDLGMKRGELDLIAGGPPCQGFSVNLYEEYTSLKSRKLEELPRFRVMSWRPF